MEIPEYFTKVENEAEYLAFINQFERYEIYTWNEVLPFHPLKDTYEEAFGSYRPTSYPCFLIEGGRKYNTNITNIFIIYKTDFDV